METYLQVSIPVPGNDGSDMLVALLGDAGFEGFEQAPKVLHAFVPLSLFNPRSLEESLAVAGLPADGYSSREIAPRNWNAEWEREYPDVRIGSYCRVRAPFHAPDISIAYDLLITPKMSFGTGHHATTYMMIDAMQHLSLNGKNVLDFGTGTGVLAILAGRSGATAVRAIDNDSWSIENALENFAVNGCESISLAQKDSLEGEGVFDVILANVNLRVILGAMPYFGQHLGPHGVLVGSGVLEDDEEKIRSCASNEGFLMNVLNIRENWMSFSLKKRIIS